MYTDFNHQSSLEDYYATKEDFKELPQTVTTLLTQLISSGSVHTEISQQDIEEILSKVSEPTDYHYYSYPTNTYLSETNYTNNIHPGSGMTNSGTSEAQIWNVNVDGQVIVIDSNAVTLADAGVSSSKIQDGAVQLNHFGNNGCAVDQIIRWNGIAWICDFDQTTGGVTEAQIEAYIFDADNIGILSSGTLDLDSLSFSGVLIDTNISDAITISALGTVSDGALSSNVTILGQDISLTSEVTDNLPLANGGTGRSLADPNVDSLLFWDDSGTIMEWLTLGSNLSITGTTLNAAASGTGTVTSVGTGNGLTGGTITTSGTVSIDSPTCSGTDKLQWTGSAFICSVDIDTDNTFTAGTDLDLNAGSFDIESQLDGVSVISRTSSNLTLQTITSGDILLSPVGGVGIGTSPSSGVKLEVNGTARFSAFQLGTSTTAGYILTADVNGIGTWQAETFSTAYNGTTAYDSGINWSGTATTTTGVATFNVTTDGTGSGTAIFTTVYSLQATAITNTGSAISVPLTAIKSITGDNKTITVNCVTGTTLLSLGNTTVFCPDGTTVYLNILGK